MCARCATSCSTWSTSSSRRRRNWRSSSRSKFGVGEGTGDGRARMGTVGTAVAIAGIAYLVGSIPAAYIVGRMVSGVDMRVAGEGNVGARNAYHVVGRGWGVAGCLVDAAEGGAVAVAF